MSTQTVPTTTVVMTALVTLVMMEFKAVLISTSVLTDMTINVKLAKVGMVSALMTLLVTLAHVLLATAMTGMLMNGTLLQVLIIKFALTSMSVPQMIMTVMKMPHATISMVVMNVSAI